LPLFATSADFDDHAFAGRILPNKKHNHGHLNLPAVAGEVKHPSSPSAPITKLPFPFLVLPVATNHSPLVTAFAVRAVRTAAPQKGICSCRLQLAYSRAVAVIPSIAEAV
jgi:hypothetical protein